MIPQHLQIAFVLITILLLIATLVWDRIKTSWAFLAAVGLLALGGSVEVESFVAGISNPSILTIFILIIITAGINDFFDLAAYFEKLFGSAGNQRSFILRMGLSVSAISSVMNNTPVVAMMMPYVYQWGRKHGINPSRLLIPLSYSAILGGVITLIGTSTNLVLNGLLGENGHPLLGFGDFFIPGVLVTLGCLFFLYLAGPWLLRDKKEILKSLEENAREYLVESTLVEGSQLSNKTVEEAGLRNLESVFLSEIIRDNVRISPVKPTEILKDEDVLLFAGETKSTLEFIKKTQGLELHKKEKLQIKDNAEIIEAIVTQNSLLDRQTVKQSGFREKYDAAIIGIHRAGEKMGGKIGAMQLRTGDLLLLTAGPEFRSRNKRGNDLLIINALERKEELSPKNKLIFFGSLLISAGLAIFGVLSLFNALMIILLTQLVIRMTNVENIKKNISFDLLIILISALSIGDALLNSGAADYITGIFFSNAANWSPLGVVAGVFVATLLLTSFITNVAAITIIFPIVLSLAAVSPVSEHVLFLTAAYAASCCFITPFAYQTNLMVMEAGNYNFNDFLRVGIPTSLVYTIIFLTFATLKFKLL